MLHELKSVKVHKTLIRAVSVATLKSKSLYSVKPINIQDWFYICYL